MKTNNQPKYIRDGRSPIPEKESTSRVMSANRGQDTKPEKILRKAIHGAGLRGYRLHWKKVPGRPDIAYPGRKKAIFVNGCFWHRCPNCNPNFPKTNVSFWEEKFNKNIERDKKKANDLVQIGWDVLTIWECEINLQIENCVTRVREFIS